MSIFSVDNNGARKREDIEISYKTPASYVYSPPLSTSLPGSVFVLLDEPLMPYHPDFIVYIRVHSWWCMFYYRFRQNISWHMSHYGIMQSVLLPKNLFVLFHVHPFLTLPIYSHQQPLIFVFCNFFFTVSIVFALQNVYTEYGSLFKLVHSFSSIHLILHIFIIPFSVE